MNNTLLNHPGKTGTNQQTFVLVHGAWSAPYVWEPVKEILVNAGYAVVAVQLPGHGQDVTDPKTIHMATYITFVSDAITAIGGSVILAGHSMAGMIISGVAEQIPQLIDRLVYIAAYAPVNGQSAYALSLLDQQSLLGASLIVSEDQSQFDLIKEDIINIFAQDANDTARQLILAYYQPEPAAPFSDPVELSDNHFGRVAKYYIETLQDHGIGNSLQKQMIIAAGITQVFELNTGHTPALTNPEGLSDVLQKIAVL